MNASRSRKFLALFCTLGRDVQGECLVQCGVPLDDLDTREALSIEITRSRPLCNAERGGDLGRRAPEGEECGEEMRVWMSLAGDFSSAHAGLRL
jgi:hypothetical protein